MYSKGLDALVFSRFYWKEFCFAVVFIKKIILQFLRKFNSV